MKYTIYINAPPPPSQKGCGLEQEVADSPANILAHTLNCISSLLSTKKVVSLKDNQAR